MPFSKYLGAKMAKFGKISNWIDIGRNTALTNDLKLYGKNLAFDVSNHLPM